MRRLLNAVSLVSFFLSLFFMGAWMRSEWVGDEVRWDGLTVVDLNHGYATSWNAESDKGSLLIIWRRADDSFLPGYTGGFVYRQYRPPVDLVADAAGFNSALSHIGFCFINAAGTGYFHPRTVVVGVPYWFLTLLTLPLTLHAARRSRRAWTVRRRKSLGLCAACGYDMRGSPERCPECGCAPEITADRI